VIDILLAFSALSPYYRLLLAGWLVHASEEGRPQKSI
jgi:hypothetical protein